MNPSLIFTRAGSHQDEAELHTSLRYCCDLSVNGKIFNINILTFKQFFY